MLIPSEVNGWLLEDSSEFHNRESIFDYMNGAGEVYLAYNFQDLLIKRLRKSNQPDILIELFDMGKAEDAYGVFSHNRESEEQGIGGGFEQRGGLICFWKDHYFVCVSAYKPTDETMAAIVETARAIDKTIKTDAEHPKLIDFVPRENLIPETIRYFHLMSSLNYHYFLSEDNILNLNAKTNAVLASYGEGLTYLLLIEYIDSETARQSSNNFGEKYLNLTPADEGIAQTKEGSWTAYQTVKNYVVIVLDAPDKETAEKLATVLL